jgi:hypothetical protein
MLSTYGRDAGRQSRFDDCGEFGNWPAISGDDDGLTTLDVLKQA